MFPTLQRYVQNRQLEFDSISNDRKELLDALSGYIQSRFTQRLPVRLIFVCTHNSRRSQLAQAWAAISAETYSISLVSCFSGGTEVTAFNPRSVDALVRAGIQISSDGSPTNPVYSLAISPDVRFDGYFSKVYDQYPNPKSDFAAIMTCGDADQRCPTIPGAELRIPLTYKDPKISDDSAAESATYDDRCAQIAREMLYMFSSND